MKLIPLTQGQFAKVDDDDFEKFANSKWCASWSPITKSFYAARTSVRNSSGDKIKKQVFLHREILCLTDPNIMGDHINHDTLDCQKHNLRHATRSQNAMNRKGPRSNSSSGIRGVSWYGPSGKWSAKISINGRLSHLGYFVDKMEAAAVYAAANKKHFGEFGGAI